MNVSERYVLIDSLYMSRSAARLLAILSISCKVSNMPHSSQKTAFQFMLFQCGLFVFQLVPLCSLFCRFGLLVWGFLLKFFCIRFMYQFHDGPLTRQMNSSELSLSSISFSDFKLPFLQFGYVMCYQHSGKEQFCLLHFVKDF